MIKTLAVTTFISFVALFIFWIWNPYESKRDFMLFSNFSTIILAITTVISIFILAYEFELNSDNSILDHRPYLSINTDGPQGYQIVAPVDKINELWITLAIKNVGQSLANNIETKIQKACLLKTMPQNLESCFTADPVNILSPATIGKSLAVYPGSFVSLQGLGVSSDTLQSNYKEGYKLFLEFTINYDGPNFKKGTKKYNATYTVMLENTPSPHMLIMSLEEK